VSPSTSPRRSRRTLCLLGALALPFLLVCDLLLAHAAAIGLSSGQLAAFTITGGPVVPNAIAYTDFTGTTGQSITTKPLDTGQNWTIDVGPWTFNGNEAVHTNTTFADAWINAGTTSAAVQVTLDFGATKRRAGVTLLGDATSFLYVVVDNNDGVDLYKRVSGTDTLLANNANVGTPTSAVLRVEAFTNTIDVYYAGSLVISYPLTAAEISLFKSPTHVRYGIVADRDPQTNFDLFEVDGP
jgi:hypothetical protein